MKTTIKYIFILICIFYSVSIFSQEKYTPITGDLIFQSLPYSELTNAIEGATKSPYSHVGIVLNKNGKWFVREAINDVHDTPLTKFVDRGRGKNIDVYRLKEKYKQHISRFILESEKYLNLPYDIKYKMDDEYIYCSELVYKSFRDASGLKLGKLVKLGDLEWGEYKALIEKLENGPVPKNRKMITPRDLAKAKYLELVHSSYKK